MARYDKYDPIANGFRAHIAADYPDANLGKIYGVGLDSTGKVVIGAGTSGIVGILVVTEKPGVVGPLRQVSRVDIMTHGCVTDFGETADTPGVDFGTAGTQYFSDDEGNITKTAPTTAGDKYWVVGTTVEPDRLEVNFNPVAIVVPT